MEIQYHDLTLGFQRQIDFRVIEDGYGHHVPSFRVMQTPDLSSLVIIYRWVDGLSKTFGDMEEAFYIDGINPGNYETAKEVITNVYHQLIAAFRENNQRDYNFEEYVNNTYGQSRRQ